MRGKGFLPLDLKTEFRITPAYAGKSSELVSTRSHIRDHPRLCGEKHSCTRIHNFSTGSPPPMRGKVGGKDESSYALRITPAYAGKSSSPLRTFAVSWDHPRLCGEK